MQPTQTFHGHLKELRRRVIYAILALCLTGSFSYLIRNRIISYIQRPLHQTLYFTAPAGSFNFVIKIATVLGIFLALPVIVYNIVKFIEPALPKRLSPKGIYKVCLASFGLAVLGGAFGYYVIVPMSLHFFLSYSSATVKPLITATEYLSFIANVFITFALIFQIPLLVLFINKFKPLNPRKLLKYQRYVVVGALIIAVLLPFTYDPISQFVLALPILFCFYVSLLLVYFANRSRNKAKAYVNIIESEQAEAVVKPEAIPGTDILPEPQSVLAANIEEYTGAEVKSPPKPKRSIFIDGFVNRKPSRPLVGYKPFDILPIEEYRARNALKGTKGSLSIDGFTFSS